MIMNLTFSTHVWSSIASDCDTRLVIKCSMNQTVSTHMRHGITGDAGVGDCGERLVIRCSMNRTVSTHMRHGNAVDGGVGD